MKHNRGNALFLILIAVALFAALSYAITTSGRGGGNIDREKLQFEITAIEDYFNEINLALKRFRILGNYEYWQINFRDNQGDPYSSAGPNGACSDFSQCSMFKTDGGPVKGYKISSEFRQKTFAECNSGGSLAGRILFTNTAVLGIGNDSERDFVLKFSGANDALCMAINDKYGVPNNGNLPPSDADNGACGFAHYSGTLTQEVVTASCVEIGDNYPALSGHNLFCVKNFNGCNFIYSVVMAR